MARCIGCGTEIPDGTEYCEACLSKLNTAKDSESYLDSLLNAVMTEEPKRREIVYPKREASSLVSMPEETKTIAEEIVTVSEEIETVSEPVEDEAAPESTEESSLEDAFGMFFDGETDLPDLKSYNIFDDMDESTINRMLAEELEEEPTEEELDSFEDEEKNDVVPELFYNDVEDVEDAEDEIEEVPLSEVGDIEEVFGVLEDARGEDAPDEIQMVVPDVISASELDYAADTFSGIVEEDEEEDAEPVAFGNLADLFADEEETESAETSESEAVEQSMDDFADLFGDMDGLFEFGAEPMEMDEQGEVRTETELSVLPSEDTERDSLSEDDSAESAKKAKKERKKKKGGLSALYHKLFDNVKVDPSKIKHQPTKEELAAQKKAKQEEKERSKEEKETLLAEKKEQEKQIKLEKQRVKKEAKAEKKVKKMEEAKLLLEEMERTRINRAGASIVFIFFAMIAVVIIVGTSIFSYSLSIKNAEYEFNRDEYTLAYNEIYGLEIKDEDILLYDRIMTVMYVQKQLNSYYNYYGMNDKPKALDSLLKGLQRYEKYIELSVDLEVDSDLDSVRKKILTEVSTSFLLTEQEAMEIIQSDSQAEYSKKVYDAVDELE